MISNGAFSSNHVNVSYLSSIGLAGTPPLLSTIIGPIGVPPGVPGSAALMIRDLAIPIPSPAAPAVLWLTALIRIRPRRRSGE